MKHEKLLKKLEIDEDLRPFVDHYITWFHENIKEIISTEQTLVSPRGYAGTADLYAIMKDGKRALLDYKTQGVKESGPNFYDSWAYQLAAYVNCLPKPRSTRCISLVINSNEPEPLVDKEWSKKEIGSANKVFRAALTIWQLKKKYQPSKEERDEASKCSKEEEKPIQNKEHEAACSTSGSADEPNGENKSGVEGFD